jgi:hypothetical protein
MILAYNPHFIFLKVISQLMEEICPYQQLDLVSRDSISKDDSLTYGYFLKLQMAEKVTPFRKHSALRRNFHDHLHKKRASG